MLALLLCLTTAHPPGDLSRPLDLYERSLEQARNLHSQRVEVLVEVGCPVDVGDGFTLRESARSQVPDRLDRLCPWITARPISPEPPVRLQQTGVDVPDDVTLHPDGI
jgi:hypothetical protein